MTYHDLLHSLEKICVLVAITYFVSRTEAFGTLLTQHSRRRDRLFISLFFYSLSLTEILFYPHRSLLDARIIAAAAAGLSGGLLVGAVVGGAVALTAAGVDPDTWLGGVPPLVGGLLGGWVSALGSEFRPKLLAGFLVGALSQGTRLAVKFAGDPFIKSWDAVALEYSFPIALSGIGVVLFLVIINDMRLQRERIAQQAEAVSRAELKALQAQVHPHFLFNALNTIVGLCEIDPRRAAELTIKLGEFFRGSFRTDREPEATVREELAAVATYLDIERARFGDKLKVTEEVDPSVMMCRLPSFALQPLVENAILHGISRKTDAGNVKIAIRRRKTRLVCWVADDGGGFDQTALDWRGNGSHALSMLASRLEKLYGRNSGLRIRSRPGMGTVACLWVPLMVEPQGD